MKKTFYRKFIAIGLGISFLTFSCTDLNEKLYDRVTADNFFKTQDEFIASLMKFPIAKCEFKGKSLPTNAKHLAITICSPKLSL